MPVTTLQSVAREAADAGGSGKISPPSWAVVSFLFEDTVWCDWIYREFDGERIPRPLISRPTRFGTPYPERISVSPDPSDPVQLEGFGDTLVVAQHLILVVSPASARSASLAEHLRIFKASGGEERVIALVVKGEPASPSAEPGAEEDRAWLPSWLDWRFDNNQFSPAASSEPQVIDARLGVSSLAEVRARLMAALLEVDRAELNELGIVTRPMTSLGYPMTQLSETGVSAPTPSSITFAQIADGAEVTERQSHLPIWICGFAALAALGVLTLWPTPPTVVESKVQNDLHPVEGASRSIAPDFDLVEAQAIIEAPFGTSIAATESAKPVIADQQPASDVIPPNAPISTNVLPTRQDFLQRRDKLIRLAEIRMAAGDSEDALHILEQAAVVGRDLTRLADSGPLDAIDLALLHRRAGTLAEGLSSPATARRHYTSARQALVELKSKGALSRDAMRSLAEAESSLRQLHRE